MPAAVDQRNVRMIEDLCIVVACNDDASLAQNLMASDLIRNKGVPVHVERGAPSASVAYNRGLAATTQAIVIFAHQDVYFPPGWEAKLAAAIAQIEVNDPNWALLAPFGMSMTGAHIGDVWTTSLSRRVGQPVTGPTAVQSYDELVIIMRRASLLQFDNGLPRFHLYGTDIVQTARAQGLGAYVADMPVVHNDHFHDRLRGDFAEGYHYVRRKWRANLPLRTSVLWIRWHGLSLLWYRLRAARSLKGRKAMAGDTNTDPQVFSARSGWE
jgi:glycosyltransferase involved in cell wall biosynthesis